MRRPFAGTIFAAILPAAALCQSTPTRPKFDIADVHVSPRDVWVKTFANQMRVGIFNAGRYEIRRATMLDLIRTAYAVDADQVYGGPGWLDYDRFEVIAKAPASTRQADLRLMLQSLLADRFNLVVQTDTKPVPAFVLSVGKGGAKLKHADGSGSAGCQSMPAASAGPSSLAIIRCRNVTLTTFAAALRNLARGYFRNVPVVDATGIEDAWDIDLQYPPPGLLSTPENIVDSVAKQLGLSLVLGEAPQRVLSVESVKEQPAANPSGTVASLPPLPSPEFEVASIKPCDGTGSSRAPQFLPGGRVTAHCWRLINLISQIWDLSPGQYPPGAPKWLTAGGAPEVSIDAKAPAGVFVDATGAQDRDALNAMMRAMLADRFKLVVHYEERPVDAYTLMAVKPKLTKADPAGRTGCTREITPEKVSWGISYQLVCRNITMTQFAEQIRAYDATVFFPVLDGTALDGSWDFRLKYAIRLNPGVLAAGIGGANGGAEQASDPSGALSFAEALPKQLGLKLELHKRPERVLVIDHIEEKPTEN